MSGSEERSARMSAYLDAQLDAKEAEEFEAYLEKSDGAREELADLRRMLDVVGSLPDPGVPSDFYDSVARKLRRRRFLNGEIAATTLVSLPFQLISIVAIIIVAALYLMAELERDQKFALPPAGETSGSSTGH